MFSVYHPKKQEIFMFILIMLIAVMASNAHYHHSILTYTYISSFIYLSVLLVLSPLWFFPLQSLCIITSFSILITESSDQTPGHTIPIYRHVIASSRSYKKSHDEMSKNSQKDFQTKPWVVPPPSMPVA